jgi:hypothetical protein
MSREETEMIAEDDSDVMLNTTRSLHKSDKREKKRKRRSHDKDKNSPNRTMNVEESNLDPSLKGTLDDLPKATPSPIQSPKSSKPRRQNPFSLAGVKSPFSGADDLADSESKKHVSPSQKLSSPTSSKKIVQFNEDDITDDDVDYTPPAKRKALLTSPRLPLSPNGTFASPKKINNRDKLQIRRRDLEEERRRLPIWTGIALESFLSLL